MFFINRILYLVPHIFMVGLFLVVCLGLGFFSFLLLKKGLLTIINALTSIILGYCVVSYYYFLIGMFSLYKEPFLISIPLICGITTIFINRACFIEFLRRIYGLKRFLVLIFIVTTLLTLYKVFPDKGFDSNWYHLSQPAYYLKEGRIFHVGGYIFPSGYPQFTEMLFVPLLRVGDSTTTSAFSLANFLLLGVAVFVLGKGVGLNNKLAAVATLSTLTTEKVFDYAGVVYVDNLQALSLTVAFYWLFIFRKTNDIKDLVLSSLMLVPVVVSKYTGAMLCVPLVLFLVKQQRARNSLVLASASITGLIPWLIRNYIEVGNFIDPVGKVQMFHYGSSASNYIGYLKSINWSHTALLLRSYPTDILTVTLITLLITAGLLQRRWLNVLFALLTLLIWRALPPGDEYRYFVPYIPIISVLGIKSIGEIKFHTIKWVLYGFVTLMLINQTYHLLAKLSPFSKYAFGAETAQDYKDHFFGMEPYMFYDPTGEVKREVQNNKLIIKGADLIYPAVVEFNVKDYSFADLDRNKIYTFKTLRDEMEKNKYHYILTNRGDLANHFNIWFKETDGDKVTMYFNVVFREDNGYGKEWFLYKTV